MYILLCEVWRELKGIDFVALNVEGAPVKRLGIRVQNDEMVFVPGDIVEAPIFHAIRLKLSACTAYNRVHHAILGAALVIVLMSRYHQFHICLKQRHIPNAED